MTPRRSPKACLVREGCALPHQPIVPFIGILQKKTTLIPPCGNASTLSTSPRMARAAAFLDDIDSPKHDQHLYDDFALNGTLKLNNQSPLGKVTNITDQDYTFLPSAAAFGSCSETTADLFGAPLAECNAQDSSGLTPLHFAVMDGSAAEVTRLSAAGANVNAPDSYSCTPLHYAAAYGHAAAAKELIRACASLKSQNKEGSSALHLAAAAGHASAVKVIADATASRRRSAFLLQDASGHTPLSAAAHSGHVQVISALARHYTSYDVTTSAMLESAVSTALCVAAAQGHAEAVQCLLAAGKQCCSRS